MAKRYNILRDTGRERVLDMYSNGSYQRVHWDRYDSEEDRRGGGADWSSYWSQQPEVLFLGLYSEISGGQMPNKVTGATDFLTVAGSVGSETYQCPNTAAYIAADTDYIWFKTDTTQRTTTTAELIGYDLQRTPVKYEDNAPNSIIAIMILKSGAVLSASKRNYLFRDMWLSILWDNNLNAYGHIKSNRVGQQLWTHESTNEPEVATYITGLATPLSAGHLTNLNTFVAALKSGLSITNLSDAFDVIRILAGETEESSLKNLVRDAHHATAVNAPAWTQFEGYTGNATNQYLDSNYNPVTQGVNYTLNSASLGGYWTQNNIATQMEHAICGALQGLNNDTTYLLPCYSVNYSRFHVNADASSSINTNLANSLGTFITSRTASNLTTMTQNGVSKGTTTQVSNGIANMNIWELAVAGFGKYSSRQTSLIFYGRGFSVAEALIIHNAFEAYMDANGKGVV